LFHAANALGIRPTEPSPPEKPCRLSTAFCSLAGSLLRARSRRDGIDRVRPVSSRSPAPCRVPLAREGSEGATKGSGARVSPDREGRPSTTRLPGQLLRRPRSFPSGSPSRGPAARFEALLLSGVRSRGSRSVALAGAFAPTPLSARPPGRFSPGLVASPELSPPRSRVRSTARARGGRPPHAPGRPRPAPVRSAALRSRGLGPRNPTVAPGWPSRRATGGRCARPRPLSAAPLPLVHSPTPRGARPRGRGWAPEA